MRHVCRWPYPYYKVKAGTSFHYLNKNVAGFFLSNKLVCAAATYLAFRDSSHSEATSVMKFDAHFRHHILLVVMRIKLLNVCFSRILEDRHVVKR
jgi:hypothetical protein